VSTPAVTALEVRAPAEQTEGTRSQLLRWLKALGERVAENEPLIEIETDKVTVEVAAPGAGILSEILKHEQDEIEPGELLARIEVAAAGPAPAARAAAEASAAPAPVAAGAARAPAGGQLSPAVRRLLAERGLEAAQVRGTGPAGRIMVEDVLRAGTAGAAAPAAAPAADAPAVAVAAPAESVRRIAHTPVRRRIAEHMVQSLLHTSPHVTSVFEADLGRVLADRARQRPAFAAEGVPLTLTAYFVQAAVAGLRAVPEANSRWTDTALELYEEMNVGIATAVEGTGLVVPVLHGAQARDLKDTARGLDELVQRARAGRLTREDVRGGTFTLSNHGVSGSLLAAPIIINQPQAAILGIGKLERRAVVVAEGGTETIVVRPRCYVTLTLDHRVMDGHQANRFLEVFVAHLNEWPA
jgi:2-oxoglutarate dehydrogenase E2 component (dihydrolipoamide succinyltransferase)